MVFSVEVTDAARGDINALVAYVAEHSGVRNAVAVARAIEAAVASLADLPGRGAPLRAGRGDVRWILSDKGTQVLYRVDALGRVVRIIAVAHRGRSVNTLVKDRS
jgi:plasmid stabilization system protein ParE